MAKRTDADLLAALASVLKPIPTAPDQVTLSRLRMTMNELNAETLYPAVTAPNRSTLFSWFTRQARNHTSMFILALVSIVSTGGVAAAAVVTDHLPGPTRAIAYDLGLPVTSPALHQAQQKMAQLKRSLTDHDLVAARHTGNQLSQDLQGLNEGDLSQIQDSADDLLMQAGVSVPAASTTTTTIAPSDSTDQNPTTTDSSDVTSTVVPQGNSPSTTTTTPIPTDTLPSDEQSSSTTTTPTDTTVIDTIPEN